MPVSAETEGRCSSENALGNSGAARPLFRPITRTLRNVTNSRVESGVQLKVDLEIFGDLSEILNC
jgi:hypothetical protein